VWELEKAETEIRQLKLQFEGKLMDLLQEKTDVIRERDEALVGTRSEKELETLREQYEQRLRGLVEQINSYRQKFAESQKLLKTKSQNEQQIADLKVTVGGLQAEKQELVRKIRDEQKTTKSVKDETSKEMKKLQRTDMQKATYIKQLEKDNETQRGLAKMRLEETMGLKGKLKTLLQVSQQKLEEQRKHLNAAAAAAKAAPPKVFQRDQQASNLAAQKKAQLDKDLHKW